ncbi:bifunctional aspartate kinase/homoserine dehydrogenase II [Pseudoalteromonas agarivorans]|uniref:Bifunctional aspartate kinase/homoserine dehydrogenase II n=1 Tax=Pseudoalteromonas agarivorans TaxID=176102 RepID=A0ABR5VRS0_9GAMM|nr:bifunctional aspartate kinase/homoserine dehydrogenase II [Pseudoalteromonas telluritireducens]KYL33281.1 bifunctional aspartate kinase/homoserine dehydrogenase II [Pseudoalteromonas telluritireducens]
MVKSVHKFGGSSLSSGERYQSVAKIIIGHTQPGDCVVVSAAGKTTDTLVSLWQSYQQQDKQAVADILLQLSNHQTALIEELLKADAKHTALAVLAQELSDVAEQASKQQLQEAALLAHGELWSARLLAAYLTQLNIQACAHDARALFSVTSGELLHAQNKQQCSQVIDANKINVVTGFIAASADGKTVTLGRNGSDYSATLLANYCDAQNVCIWTDTPGVFSADPRKVEKAIKYNKVCREQANLLARLGNPVLHAKTLSPLKNSNIKLAVRSSFDVQTAPTDIVKQGKAKQKRFITTLQNVDLLLVEGLNAGEVAHVSQLIQHSLHHFIHNGDTYLVVPAGATHQVVSYFAGRANISESNLNGCAVVAPTQDVYTLSTLAAEVLNQQSIHPRFIHQDTGYTLLLTDQLIESDVLSLLHEKLINKGQEVALVVAGLGNVGDEFLSQLDAQFKRLSGDYSIKLVGLIRSQHMLFNASGITLGQWKKQWQHNAVAYEQADLLSALNELDYEHKVVVDITASEQFSQLYTDFVERDCHLISANKYAGTAASSWYNALRQSISERNLHWRYNTSVGAGLPINFALADLQNSGDKITRIEGVFSGTLSWLCSKYDGSVAFSDLVLEAQKMGFTEPDPREDLSGRDMQRKLLILARELGIELDLDDISLQALMPDELAQGSWGDFLANKDKLNAFIKHHADAANAQDAVLRYTGLLALDQGKVSAKVGITYAPKGDALANLTPGDNIFVINSQWYNENALVIQGPGAGKEVTAAGVHSDLYWLVKNLK